MLEAFLLDVTTSRDEWTCTHLNSVVSTRKRPFTEECPFFFYWPLCCLFLFDIRILIASLWCLQTLLTLFVFDCAYCVVPLLCFSWSCVSYVASFSLLSFLIDPSIFSDVYILPEDNVVVDYVVIDLPLLTTHVVSSNSF